MTTRSGAAPSLALSAARAAWGALLLAAPGRVLTVGHGRDDRASRAVLRVLGARHLAQAAVTIAVPTAVVLNVGAAVDLMHAGSAAVFALVDSRQRRYALSETALAVAWAAASRSIGSRTS